MNPDTTPRPPVGTTDLRALYEKVAADGAVPSPADRSIGRSRAEFRGMYLDLGEIKAAVAADGLAPTQTVVHADVLSIPDGLSWSLKDAALVILARRVQVGGSAQLNLDLRTGPKASLILFADEVIGTLTAVAIPEAAKPATFPIATAPPSGGVRVALGTGGAQATPLDRSQGIGAAPSAMFRDALTTEFLFASLLYDQEPELALAQLTWIKSWSAESPDLLGMFLRSSSLVALLSAQVRATAGGARFVPYLSSNAYGDLAAAFVAAATEYERDYRALSSQAALTDNDIQLARTLLSNQLAASDYTAKLIEQSQANYANAVAAAEAARRNFEAAQLRARLTNDDFQKIGIEEFKEKEIIKAVFTLATALFTFGVAIGSMFLGNPAGGAAAAGEAAGGVKAVEGAVESGAEVATMAKNLADLMEKLKKTMEALEKVYEFSKEVVAAGQDIDAARSKAASMKGMDLGTRGADLSDTSQWQIYRDNIEAVLKDPVDKGVRYADDYRLALGEVAIYGQALAAAKLAVITAGQQYATVLLQRELAQRQQQNLEGLVDALTAGQAPTAALMQEFYQRYLDAKGTLFAAVQGYRASFFYWALQPSSVRPRIIDPVVGLDGGLKDITSIAMDRAAALQRFSPPPQTLSQLVFEVDDEAILAALRTAGSATWAIALDAEPFVGLDRVRLRSIRVWLEGGRPIGNASVKLDIANSGIYLDRFQGNEFQFTAKPFEGAFWYGVSSQGNNHTDWSFRDGTFGTAMYGGTVDEEVKYAYFDPTPFSAWTLTVANPKEVDLSRVTAIRMEVGGSAIPQTASDSRRIRAAAALPAGSAS